MPDSNNISELNADIDECLAAFKNATFGEEVRDALIRAIELCYADVVRYVIENTLKGDPGKSAFELYKEANPDYVGTVEDWLASLVGAQGPEGPEGPPGSVDVEGLQIAIDNSIDGNSSNPVQNKVIKAALDNKLNAIPFTSDQARRVLVVGNTGRIVTFGSRTYGKDNFNSDPSVRSNYIPSEKSVSNYTYSKEEADSRFVLNPGRNFPSYIYELMLPYLLEKADVDSVYDKEASDERYCQLSNVDSELSYNSENPVQNKVIKAAIDEILNGDLSINIDDAFYTNSTNAVQSRVIKAALDQKLSVNDANLEVSSVIDDAFSFDNPQNNPNNWPIPGLFVERATDTNTNKCIYYLTYVDSECDPFDSEIGGEHFHRIANLSTIFETVQNKVTDFVNDAVTDPNAYPTVQAVREYVNNKLLNYTGTSIHRVFIQNGNLCVELEDDSSGTRTTEILGSVIGPQGPAGTNGLNGSSYSNATINSSGNLVLMETASDGTQRTVDVGHVVGANGTDSNLSEICEIYSFYDKSHSFVRELSNNGNPGNPNSPAYNGMSFSINTTTGEITMYNKSGMGYIYLVDYAYTLEPGTYYISGKITLSTNVATNFDRFMRINLGNKTSSNVKQVYLTTERGGTTRIAQTEFEGWFGQAFTISSNFPLTFLITGDGNTAPNSSSKFVVSDLQIVKGGTIKPIRASNLVPVDIVARGYKTEIDSDISTISAQINSINSTLGTLEKVAKDQNGIIYTTATARHSYTTQSGGIINFTIGDKLNTRLYSDYVNSLDWGTISSEITEYITINGNAATITLDYNKALVYNITDKKLYRRVITSSSELKSDDILLILNGWGIPLKGVLYDEYISRKTLDLQTQIDNFTGLTRNEILTQSFNASYHTGATDFVTKCTEFNSFFYGDDVVQNQTASSDYESFLFFTDPHLLLDSGWENQCYEMISQIQKYYNSTPTSFCLCGGDWIGKNDLPSVACYKIGYVTGFMHEMFDNCYLLVGNHDTNYQGKATSDSPIYGVDTWTATTALSVQSVSNLMYYGRNAYYTFDGKNTRFYCFDSRRDDKNLSTIDNYLQSQVIWFARELEKDGSEHIALAIHILYRSWSNGVGQNLTPFSDYLLTIAEAYNSRSQTVIVNGTILVDEDNNPIDYSQKTGRVEFLIAGHTHADGNEDLYLHGIPCIITTWVRASSTVATFDLCYVDYINRVFKTVRVGSGSNRTFYLDQP